MTDRRTRDFRDGEILDTIIRTGGISTVWLKSNPQRPAALLRMKDACVIREVPGGWEHFKRYELVPQLPRAPWWVRLWRKACGEESV